MASQNLQVSELQREKSVSRDNVSAPFPVVGLVEKDKSAEQSPDHADEILGERDPRDLDEPGVEWILLAKIIPFYVNCDRFSCLFNKNDIIPFTRESFVKANDIILRSLDKEIRVTASNFSTLIPRTARRLGYYRDKTWDWLLLLGEPASNVPALAWLSWLVQIVVGAAGPVGEFRKVEL